jgi:hypothetical protein
VKGRLEDSDIQISNLGCERKILPVAAIAGAWFKVSEFTIPRIKIPEALDSQFIDSICQNLI